MKCVERLRDYRIYRAGPIEGLHRFEGHDFGVYAPGTSPWDGDAPEFVSDMIEACEEWIADRAAGRAAGMARERMATA